MGLVRQLPTLYVRGALAHVTMRNLTAPERQRVDEVVRLVTEHPKMAGHRGAFRLRLQSTIRADYKDPAIADAEFAVAVWRATVSLLYHRRHSFKCRACGAEDYLAKNRKRLKIDRQFIPCPSCRQVATPDGFQQIDANLPVTSVAAELENQRMGRATYVPENSPIDVTAGDLQYPNSEEILADPVQMSRFFGEFVMNYVRQLLRENRRESQEVGSGLICDRADLVIIQEFQALIELHRVRAAVAVGHVETSVSLAWHTSSPEFSLGLARLLQRAAKHGVVVTVTDRTVTVRHDATLDQLQGTVVRREHVLVAEPATEEGEHGEQAVGSQHQQLRGGMMIGDDDLAEFDITDRLTRIRERLPDGDCRRTFDLFAQTGPEYYKFAAPLEQGGFGDAPPRLTTIANYLGTTTKVVARHRETIRHVVLAEYGR